MLFSIYTKQTFSISDQPILQFMEISDMNILSSVNTATCFYQHFNTLFVFCKQDSVS